MSALTRSMSRRKPRPYKTRRRFETSSDYARRVAAVDHPAHYGGDTPHEVVKCLEAWGLEADALLWNTVKYIARNGKKVPALEDLKKARWYLDRRILKLEAAK